MRRVPCVTFCALIFSVLSLFFSDGAFCFKLPDTGETTCYSQTGAVIGCPAPENSLAQDGSYPFNPMSFTDNGDGTVTDDNTGLIWQKQPDNTVYNWYQASGTYDATYNPSSQNACSSLNLGGHSDWRLPSKKELITLVDYSVTPGPTINTAYFPGTKSDAYWTSPTYAGHTSSAWRITFDEGGAGFTAKSGNHFVRCVRGGQLSSTGLIDNGNGTVTDTRTGLLWQQGEASAPMRWDAALSYCEGLSLENRTDWRLPNVKELESLTDDSRYNPTLDKTFFPGVHSSRYWTSTTYVNALVYAWAPDFLGDNMVTFAAKSNTYFARCARGGQFGSVATLDVNPTGAGNGAVVSWPGGIDCGAICSAPYQFGTIVTLTATPAVGGSIFVGWDDDADCADGVVTMTADAACTATFDFCPGGHPARIGGTTYDSIAAAYAGAGMTGDIIDVIASNQQETLDFNQGKVITLKGGNDCAFAPLPYSQTTITGSITINSGTITLDRIVLR